ARAHAVTTTTIEAGYGAGPGVSILRDPARRGARTSARLARALPGGAQRGGAEPHPGVLRGPGVAQAAATTGPGRPSSIVGSRPSKAHSAHPGASEVEAGRGSVNEMEEEAAMMDHALAILA